MKSKKFLDPEAEFVANLNNSFAVTKALKRIKSRACPFCGQKELYAYPPKSFRLWWIVGCQSTKCDSSWKIENERLDHIEGLIHSTEYIWIYTVDNKGRVTHERSFPLQAKREARERVSELNSRGVVAFSSTTFIKDAYA